MMQQQAILTAGLHNAGMPVMNFTADATNANMTGAGAQIMVAVAGKWSGARSECRHISTRNSCR